MTPPRSSRSASTGSRRSRPRWVATQAPRCCDLSRIVCVRRSQLGDFLARVGDDEFVILQSPSPQPQSATAMAARLVDLLGRSYLADGHLINMDACVGVCVIPADGEDCDKILNNADLALSHARQDGPRRFRFFEAAMDAQCEARRSLEVDLRRALALRELCAGLSAAIQSWIGADHRLRSAAALAPSETRTGVAGRFHSARGRTRPDHADRRMGVAQSLPRSRQLARSPARRRERLRRPVSRREPLRAGFGSALPKAASIPAAWSSRSRRACCSATMPRFWTSCTN